MPSVGGTASALEPVGSRPLPFPQFRMLRVSPDPVSPASLPILVTGASGFIGRAASLALAGAGRPVLALGRRGAALPVHPGVTALAADLTEPGLIATLPPVGAVLHLAYASDRRGVADTAAIVAADLRMTEAALAIARRHGARFLLASTGSLYGTADRPFVEDDPTGTAQDLDGYLAAKLACEALVRERCAPAACLVVRLFFPYGPGMRRDTLFDRLLWPARATRPVQLDGADGLVTNPVHIDDVAEALCRLLAVPVSGAVNLGGPETVTLRSIGDRAARLGGHAARYTSVVPTRAPMLAGDLGRLGRLLGWLPAIGIDEGLRRTLSADSPPCAAS